MERLMGVLRHIVIFFMCGFFCAAFAGEPLYTVVDGNKVDSETLKGFKAWRAAACDRCHGANQQGLVGPSLIERLKILTRDEFVKTVTEGRRAKGIPSFKTSKLR